MRVALVGAGRIGQLHARHLGSIAGVSELLIADADAARAHAVAASVGATPVATAQEAIARADALVVAAATNAHAMLVRAGIDRGIPVFCEKPLAFDLAESVALVDHIERARVPVQIGFQRRFDAGYREARRLVESGEIGVLYSLRLTGHDAEPPHEAFIPTSGGLFRDLAIHDFDLLRWLTGSEVEEVYADGGVRNLPVFAKYGDVDTAVATARMSNGVLAAMTVARHDPLGYDVRTELFGSLDSVTVGLDDRTPLRSLEATSDARGRHGWRDFLERFAGAYRDELVTFLAVASGEQPSPCTARDGLEAMRIAVAATQSLHERRVVRLSEVR